MTASGSIVNRLIATKYNSDLGSSLLTQKLLLPFVQLDFMKKHYTLVFPTDDSSYKTLLWYNEVVT